MLPNLKPKLQSFFFWTEKGGGEKERQCRLGPNLEWVKRIYYLERESEREIYVRLG
jgi:hypothetical protein